MLLFIVPTEQFKACWPNRFFSRVIERASKIDEYVSLFVILGLHLFSFILLLSFCFVFLPIFNFYIFYFVYFPRSSFRLPSGGIL